MLYKYLILLVFILVASCQYFKKSDNRTPIARVNETFLYTDDIENLTLENTSKTDSTLIIQNYIKSWATQQLLLDGALLNLSESKQAAFNKLVDQYRDDLFTKAYIEALVKRSVDTIVNNEEAKKYYATNEEAFKLNESLIKFRYIHVDEKIINFSDIEKKFKRFDSIDKKELDSISIQFKSYSLNDSIWIRVKQVVDKIPVITPLNEDELLKKSNFVQL